MVSGVYTYVQTHQNVYIKYVHYLYTRYIFIKLINFFFFFGFCPFRTVPAAFGYSQPRGLIGTVAARLCQSHRNVRSKQHLRPTAQLTATPDP